MSHVYNRLLGQAQVTEELPVVFNFMMASTDALLTTDQSGDDVTRASTDDIEKSTDFVMVAMYTTASLSFLLNGFVFGVMMTSRKLRRKLSVMFLVHQLACDCFSAGCILIFFAIETQYGEVKGLLGLLYCKLVFSQFIVYSAMNAGVFNTVFLSVERYLAVVHPLKYRKVSTRRNFIVSSAFCWLLGFILNTPYVPMTMPTDAGTCEVVALFNSENFLNVYTGVYTFITFLLPLIIIVVLYAQMFNTLRRRKEGLAGPPSTENTTHISEQWTSKMYNAQIKLIRIVVLLEVSCLISWTPYNVYAFLFSIGENLNFGDPLYYASVVFSVTNLILNPVIYMCGYDEFHACAKKLFCGTQKDLDRNGSNNWSVSHTGRP